MQIILDVPVRGRDLAEYIRNLLNVTSDMYAVALRNNPLPPLYRTQVRYRHEPTAGTGKEFFDSPWTVYSRGWGDCDDLVLWRLAELKAGMSHATAVALRETKPETGRFHVGVRRWTGQLEDPSLMLIRLEETRNGSR